MGFRTRLVLILLTVLLVALGAMLAVGLLRSGNTHTDKDDSDVNSNTSPAVTVTVGDLAEHPRR